MDGAAHEAKGTPKSPCSPKQIDYSIPKKKILKGEGTNMAYDIWGEGGYSSQLNCPWKEVVCRNSKKGKGYNLHGDPRKGVNKLMHCGGRKKEESVKHSLFRKERKRGDLCHEESPGGFAESRKNFAL